MFLWLTQPSTIQKRLTVNLHEMFLICGDEWEIWSASFVWWQHVYIPQTFLDSVPGTSECLCRFLLKFLRNYITCLKTQDPGKYKKKQQ